MERTRGRINKIWQNQTKQGKAYWTLSVKSEDGQFVRYTVWRGSLLEGIAEGDTVSYKFSRKGNYNNIFELYKTEQQTSAPGNLGEYPADGRVDQIARMSAIKSAAQLLSMYSGDPAEKMTKTLEAAKEFEKYIFGSPDNGGSSASESKNGGRKKAKKKEAGSERPPEVPKETPAPNQAESSDLPF